MCVVLGLWDHHPDYSLMLIANRDEFFARPAQPASWWDGTPRILAGRDLRDGGTWLGVTAEGKIAALTSYRDLENLSRSAERSRGLIVRDFLVGQDSPRHFIEALAPDVDRYSGFNLLAGEVGSGLLCWSNQDLAMRPVASGCFGLSNRFLDSPWPKVVRGKALLEEAAGRFGQREEIELIDALFAVLTDEVYPPDEVLPDTGVGLEMERMLSPIFIRGEEYGTRCSSVILLRRDGRLLFEERSHAPEGKSGGSVRVTFKLSNGVASS